MLYVSIFYFMKCISLQLWKWSICFCLRRKHVDVMFLRSRGRIEKKIVFQFEHLLHQLGHSLKSRDASMDFFFLHSQIWILRYRYDKDSIRRSALTIDIILGRREREIPLLRRGETQAVKRPCNVSRAQLMTSRLRWIPSSNNNIELKNVLGLYNR